MSYTYTGTHRMSQEYWNTNGDTKIKTRKSLSISHSRHSDWNIYWNTKPGEVVRNLNTQNVNVIKIVVFVLFC